jgi:BirA family biotin operon repressor/biotin-[acetyl-CoA-carboxylase] ligase
MKKVPRASLDLSKVRLVEWIRSWAYVPVVDSTNALAADLALGRSGNRQSERDLATASGYAWPEPAVLPLCVVADEQTAGRGRGSNRWWSSEGSLTFSVAVPLDRGFLEPQTLYSLGCGCAVAAALAPLTSRDAIRLKWPNDIMLGGRKVGGILVETLAPPSGVMIVGIGLNLNCDWGEAPAGVADRGAAVREFLGRSVPAEPILIDLLGRLGRLWTDPSGTTEVLRQFRQLDFLYGRRIRIQAADSTLDGVAQGVNSCGALIVATATGIQEISSGTVLPHWIHPA